MTRLMGWYVTVVQCITSPDTLTHHKTASIWTSPDDQSSMQAFQNFVEELEFGTVYLNRADALEPALPWSGRKDSGRGISLSTMGYDTLTRTKAVCMKVKLQ